MRGLTGVIKFDHQGFRSDFLLDIVELSKDGLRQIGTWNSTQGVNFTRSYRESQKEISEILQNRTLIVTTILVSNNICKYIKFVHLFKHKLKNFRYIAMIINIFFI